MNKNTRVSAGRPKSRARLILNLTILFCILLPILSGCSQTSQPTAAQTTETEAVTAAQTTAAQTTAVQTTVADSTTSTASGTDATPTASETETGIRPFSAEDLIIEYQGVTAHLLEDAAPLISILGDDYQLSEAESCVYEGMDKTLDYGHSVVYTVPSGDHDLLDGLDLLDERIVTARGIRVGDSRDAVLAAYGPQAGSESDLVYNVSGDIEQLAEPKLTFIMDGDSVVAISFYSGSNAQS